jgi:hypothetical protein
VLTHIDDPTIELLDTMKTLTGQEDFGSSLVASQSDGQGKPAIREVSNLDAFYSLVMTHLDSLLACNEKEFNKRIPLILYVVKKLEKDSIITHFIETVKKSPCPPTYKLQALASLYNLYSPSHSLLFHIFLNIFNIARENDLQHLIQLHLQQLDSFLSKWKNVQQADKLQLLWDAASVVSQDSFKVKFLLDFIAEAENDTRVVQAFVDVINKGDYGQIQKAIKLLKRRSVTDELSKLLSLLTKGSVEEFQQFQTSSKTFIEQTHLIAEKCLDVCRVFGLCSLAKERPEISFEDVANKLKVDIEDVNIWLVKAVTFNLIDARIDGLKNRILVTKAIAVSGTEDWQQLLTSLQSWEESLVK